MKRMLLVILSAGMCSGLLALDNPVNGLATPSFVGTYLRSPCIRGASLPGEGTVLGS